MYKKKVKLFRDIIKESPQIKKLLEERFYEFGISKAEAIKDADKNGYKISKSALSRYLTKGNVKGCLSQEDIIWLCYRYGINIKLDITSISPYNEQECLERLKSYLK